MNQSSEKQQKGGYYGSARETGDHFKNGASLKSQMSRINFYAFIAAILLVGFYSCGEKEVEDIIEPVIPSTSEVTFQYIIKTESKTLFESKGYFDNIELLIDKRFIEVTSSPNNDYSELVKHITDSINRKFYEFKTVLAQAEKFIQVKVDVCKFKVNNINAEEYDYRTGVNPLNIQIEIIKESAYNNITNYLKLEQDSLINLILSNGVNSGFWDNNNSNTAVDMRIWLGFEFNTDSVNMYFGGQNKVSYLKFNNLTSSDLTYYKLDYAVGYNRFHNRTYIDTDDNSYTTKLDIKEITQIPEWDQSVPVNTSISNYQPFIVGIKYPVIQLYKGEELIYEGVLYKVFESHEYKNGDNYTSIEFKAVRLIGGKLIDLQMDSYYNPVFVFKYATENELTESRIPIKSSDLNGKSVKFINN
jgi:hypothetical protein